MKYSANLPKITYSTTVGDFEVTDISSYFILNNDNLSKADIETSKNLTLIEMSGSVYNDVNSFWLFLLANKKLNPFDLTKTDNAVEQTNYESNTVGNAINTDNGFDVIVPAGSIVFPKIANSGDTYSFGGTGNYSLTGGFALVQSFDAFSKKYVAIEPYSGITFGVNDNVVFLINGSTGYYQYAAATGGLTQSINTIQVQSESTQKIVYSSSTQFQVVEALSEDLPPVLKGSAPYQPSGISQAFSYSQVSNNENRNIKYFLPYSVGYYNLTKVIQNYSV
jgi:hypothetical protein